MKEKISFKISVKLAIGIGISLLVVLGSYAIIYQMLIKNEKIAEYSGKNIVPSLTQLNRLSLAILESKYLTKSWVLDEQYDNTPKKRKLRQITDTTYLELKKDLVSLSSSWEKTQKQSLYKALNLADDLILQEKEIMQKLNIWEKYDDPYFELKYTPIVQEGNSLMSQADSVVVLIRTIALEKERSLLDTNSQMDSSFSEFRSRVLLSGVFLVIIIVFIGFVLGRSLLNPINYLKKLVAQMGTGELPTKTVKLGNDETGQMGLALNDLIKGLREKASFAGDIEKGNFDSEFIPISKQDILGNSLVRMRDSLVQASKEAEIRRVENQERSWAAQGIAEFNEIIREHNETLEDFTSVTISKLTKYLDSQVGGLYILNNEDKNDVFLELSAFYAYDRQRFIDKKIQLGENLVGQSVLEKDTIFMTDIPRDYVQISSGLGKDAPKSLLIVPLKLNEEIYGVFELASFNVFEPYQIEFVEKTGEIIASTIANIKINLKTSQLLEDSKEKSEKLAIQEEESRKSIDKLQITLNEKNEKEELQDSKFKKIEEEFRNQLQRSENKLDQSIKYVEEQRLENEIIMKVLDNSVGFVELNGLGEIVMANKLFLRTVKMSLIDLTGKKISDFVAKTELVKPEYILFMKNVYDGVAGKITSNYVFAGINISFLENYTPIKDKNNKVYKIIITSYLH